MAKEAYAVAVSIGLTDRQTRLLVFMALTAKDTDPEPRYYAAREESVRALGKFIPDAPEPDHPDAARVNRERHNAFKSVKDATAGLVRAGVIVSHRRGQSGQRAEYRFAFGILVSTPRSATEGHENRAPERHDVRTPKGHDIRAFQARISCPQGTTEDVLRNRHLGEDHDPAKPHVSYPQADWQQRNRLAS